MMKTLVCQSSGELWLVDCPVPVQEIPAAMKAGLVPAGLLNTHRATLSGFMDVLPQWMDPASGVIKAIVEV